MQTDRDALDREAPLLLTLGLAFCVSMPLGTTGPGVLPTPAANSALFATAQVGSNGAGGLPATAGQGAGDAK